MNKEYLDFVLKRYGITKQILMDQNDWSRSTYYRKMSGEVDWTIAEVNGLIELGVDIAEVIDIFFS